MAYIGPFPVKVEQGGTGEIAVTANAVVIGDTASQLASTNVGTNGQVLLGATSAAPEFATLTSTGATVTFTLGANSLNLEASGSGAGATTFDADSGTATTSSNTITLAGAGDVSTSATSHTVTITGSGVTTVDTGSGTVTASSNTITIAGGTGITTSGAGSTVTIAATGGTGTVTSISAGTGITLTPNPITATGSVALTVPVTVADGGTGAITLTSNGVLLGNGTSPVTATTAGTTGQVLTGVTGSAPTFQSPAASSITITGDSGGGLTGNSFIFTGGTTGLTFAGATSTETLGGTLVVSNGGTGVASTTAYAVICGGTTSTAPLQSIASVGTSGQVLTSNGAGALPTFQPTSGGGFTWSAVTISTSMAVNNGYISNSGSLLTFTLPVTAAVGTLLGVAGLGTGQWTIAQNSGQNIQFGAETTTTGASGSLSSTLQYDNVQLLCVTANTTWVVLSAVGNLTYV